MISEATGIEADCSFYFFSPHTVIFGSASMIYIEKSRNFGVGH
jgi:hypothetical protein